MLPVLYHVMSPIVDYVNWCAISAGCVISMTTLLSLIFTSDFNQAVVHYTCCIHSQITAWSQRRLCQIGQTKKYNLHEISTVLVLRWKPEVSNSFRKKDVNICIYI